MSLDFLITKVFPSTSLLISMISLGMSSYVNFKYKERHRNQKLLEIAINTSIEKLKIVHDGWLNLAKSTTYIYNLMLLEDEKVEGLGEGWNIVEQEDTDEYKQYLHGKEALSDLFYAFSDENDPILREVFESQDIRKIHELVAFYQPFTLRKLVDLHRYQGYKKMLDDLLLVKSIINASISQK